MFIHSFKKSLFIITMALLLYTNICAQIDVEYHVNTALANHEISPYIYGANNNRYDKITAIRSGGNRMTGYNWETNASHAGEDWFNNNDDFLPWNMGIPEFLRDSTAIVYSRFQENANTHQQYSLQTLPMAGYVSADKDGIVQESETAPSPRWNRVVNDKNDLFTQTPDLIDGHIFVDESINFMIEHFGNSDAPTGINAYSLDNEPSLWASTHPRIHPQKITAVELFESSASLANTIKRMDANALVFGPALYGFNAYLSLQDAPDWSTLSSDYDWFISAYLWGMRDASKKANRRLLDVLDIHWYPEPAGVYSGDTSRIVSENRMQCVRSLWDSSYVENSWIGQWFSPVALIPHLHQSINLHYPDTKLAITEYDYAGNNHISGAIAQADALGIFGQQGLYFAAKWNDIDQFVRAAFDLYLDYDGNGSKFGDISNSAASNNNEMSSIYSANESQNASRLHLIITNKDYDNDIAAKINIDRARSFQVAEVYFINKNDTNIIRMPDIDMSSDMLKLTIPKLSVAHLVLKDINTNTIWSNNQDEISVYPNPIMEKLYINSSKIDILNISIYNEYAQLINIVNYKSKNAVINITSLKAGIYYLEIQTEVGRYVKRIVKLD